MEKKRVESLYSAVDIGFNSLISFLTFLYIKEYYGIDLLGLFGLILSVTSFVETIQMGLYEKPAYLGFSVGYKQYRLKIWHLLIIIFFPLLVINQLIISGYLVSAILFCLSYVLTQNIRIHDYINHNIKKVSLRSFLTFFMTVSMYTYLLTSKTMISLNVLLLMISAFRFIFVIFERKKIFSIENNSNENTELGFLVTSVLTLVRSRLPLWSLLPFGLGLVGIYEAFRTLLEIYLVPSRPIFLVMIKNLKRDGTKKIFQFGFIFAFLTIGIIGLTFFIITSSNFFNIDEISTNSAFISIVLISLFFWISEITGMIFQFNSFISFEAIRRASSIILFVLVSLAFYNYLNFNIFLFLVAFMYFAEVVISFINKEKLKL